jgi:hypothetical protein
MRNFFSYIMASTSSIQWDDDDGDVHFVLNQYAKLHFYSTSSQWFSPGTLFSSTNKTDCRNIAEILLKVVLNTITLTLLR